EPHRRSPRPRRRPHRPVRRGVLAAGGGRAHARRGRPGYREDARRGGRRQPGRRHGRARRRLRGAGRVRRDGAAGARGGAAPGLRADDATHRRPRPGHDAGDGQAARRVQGRGHLRRGVLPLVRRGGRARRRRLRHGPRRHQPLPGHAPAGRGVPAHHAVELPHGHGHPQDRPGRRRRLRHGDQAGRADPAVDARPRRDPRRGGPARRRAQRRHHQRRRRGDGAAHPRRPRPQAVVHRLHRGREAAAGAGLGEGAAHVDGAGRQRAVPGVRRRRPRRGRRGGDGGEDAQHGRGLHRGQPVPGAARGGRGVRPPPRRADGRAVGGPRHLRRRAGRTARRREGPRQGRGAGARRRRPGRAGGGRRRPDRRAGLLLPAHGAHRRPARRAAHPRGDLRPDRGDHRLRHRGRGGGRGQRHRVRAGQLPVHGEPDPLAADGRAAGGRHDRAQHRARVQPGRPVRRDQAVRAGPRGRQRRDRGVPRDQVRRHRLRGL
ncbi:MAG: Succinate-semialdehyde dehydrogenase [NAD(P)+], partial [uncultured Pseudonocardia sp.]